MGKKSIFLLLMLLIILIAGCSNTTDNISEGDNMQSIADFGRDVKIEKLEVIHFHGTNQCYSCITVGDYAEATVNTYFSDELKSGKIVFAHLNGELMENREKVVKYGATGSSIWLGVYDETGFHAEQNINVWYKINDKQAYMDYFKGVIEKRLAGDMS